MKTQVTRHGSIEVAHVTQSRPDARWQGRAADGFESIGDSAEECRDSLCDGTHRALEVGGCSCGARFYSEDALYDHMNGLGYCSLDATA